MVTGSSEREEVMNRWNTVDFFFGGGGYPGVSVDKESTWNSEDTGSIIESERSPGRRKWLPTPVFLPGKFHGQRNPASYSPRGHIRVGHDLVTRQREQWIQ